jgi:hypothetical protein
VKINILNFKKQKPMKVIYVDKPAQDENTKDPQIIEGEIKKWIVYTERVKIGKTLRDFLEEKWDRIKQKDKENIIEGFYIYDVIPAKGIINEKNEFTGEGALFVRYDYIKKQNVE